MDILDRYVDVFGGYDPLVADRLPQDWDEARTLVCERIASWERSHRPEPEDEG